MDTQILINALLSLVAFLGGWWMRVMWASLSELRAADSHLTEKVQAIEVLVAGNYVKRDELDKLADALFKKLDRIESKVDTKMDRIIGG